MDILKINLILLIVVGVRSFPIEDPDAIFVSNSASLTISTGVSLIKRCCLQGMLIRNGQCFGTEYSSANIRCSKKTTWTTMKYQAANAPINPKHDCCHYGRNTDKGNAVACCMRGKFSPTPSEIGQLDKIRGFADEVQDADIDQDFQGSTPKNNPDREIKNSTRTVKNGEKATTTNTSEKKEPSTTPSTTYTPMPRLNIMLFILLLIALTMVWFISYYCFHVNCGGDVPMDRDMQQFGPNVPDLGRANDQCEDQDVAETGV